MGFLGSCEEEVCVVAGPVVEAILANPLLTVWFVVSAKTTAERAETIEGEPTTFKRLIDQTSGCVAQNEKHWRKFASETGSTRIWKV